ncbi:uncharacterized protein A1O9_01582 [Exophiala aquamarina CBS 119918]|uniref:Amidohydrolase-related domain-containing protein n=1 Tax=Exophiala aquamarina CBS 119918 TaxID=1182545 RepID=A0A072PU15_9EURO|nr:uncharacterized protein A1O9_01582 [Exophiala aquamarina CBS 119918]KEF63604.1 hypothetical protein A1O9_01582 [Exophiala aquamarina CBS 119918]
MKPTLIHSVTLFDGHSTHRGSTVAFDGSTGIITKVATGDSGPDVKGATEAVIIDGTGHTLIPGLIESHMHAHQMHLSPGSPMPHPLRSPLRCGVTTVCDMHCDPAIVEKLGAEIADDIYRARKLDFKITLSDLKSALYAATIDGGWPKSIVLGHDPSAEAQKAVSSWPSLTVEKVSEFIEEHKAAGADYIKLMQENHCALALPTNSIPVATLELQTAVVQAAHNAGLRTIGHALSVDMTEILLQARVDGLGHTFIDQPPPEKIVHLYKRTGSFIIPTLAIAASVTQELQNWRDRFADIAKAKALVDDFTVDMMRKSVGMKAPTARLDYAFETIKKLKAEGIDVLAGTDSAAGLQGTGIGPTLWMEMLLYVEKCGFSVTDALKSATSVPARRLGFEDRGVIGEGKRADLVLVKGELTESLEYLWEGDGIVGIWKGGLRGM